MNVAAFGPHDAPYYAADMGPGNAPRTGARDGNIGGLPAWCCPFGKGHKTPRAAAQHAARIATERWEKAA